MPPVVVVEVGQCKISDSRVSRNASMVLSLAAASSTEQPSRSRAIPSTTEWNVAKNLQSLTGGVAPTILAGYFNIGSA